MTLKPNRHLLWIAGLVIAFGILLTATGAFILPVYIQSRIIPRLAAGFGLEPMEVHVRRIGLWGADLGPIRFKIREAQALTLAAVQVDYTPWTLLHGRVKGIMLGGVGLTVEASSGGIFVAGRKLPNRDSSAPRSGAVPDLKSLMPIQLDYFRVLQSQVQVEWKGRRYDVPLEARIETAALARGVLRGRITLSIMGNPMMLEASLDQNTNSAILNIECAHFLLENLCRSGLLPADLKMAGILDLKGRAVMQLNPAVMTGLEVSGRLMETRVATARGILGNVTTAGGGSQPVELSITAKDPGHIRFVSGPMLLSGPLKTVVNSLRGDLTRGSPGWSLDAQVETFIPSQSLPGGLTFEKELAVPWRIQAVQEAGSAVRLTVSAEQTQPLDVRMEPYRMTGENFQIDLSGRFADGRFQATGLLTLGRTHAAVPDGSVTVPAVRINGTVTLPSMPLPSKVAVQALLSEVRADLASAAILLPRIDIHADGQTDPSGHWEYQGRLNIADGQMRDKVRKLAMQGLNLHLPLQWPSAAKVPAGQMNLRSIQWNGLQMGGAKGTLHQVAQSLEMSIEHRSKLFKGLVVLIKGGLNAAGIHADVHLPSYQPAQEVDLGRYIPEAGGVYAGGRLEVHSTLKIKKGVFQGQARIEIDQGTLNQDEHKLAVDGIAMTLQINDLAALKSAPRQRLRVKNIRFGDLSAENLDVDFQFEDRQTLFLEKVGLQWCRGRVNTAAIRITAGKEDYDVILFCDRLDLAMVLEQLGAAEAGGKGTVNGRIPLRWANGRLSFDNGFLYSTPGQPGQIQLKGTEALLAGMPPGTPQHTQLDIATEALKDYTYQWAKLSVQSENDILLLKLQLDGKPNRLLPFAYDQQLGQFKRITGEGQAEFKGISIDLNFKSPLNEIIHYKELLNRN